jgi:choline dehydrogenase-like flavoprotein
MLHGSALTAALRATTSEVLRVAGAYDAVVIGAGAAGGLAALLIAEAGLRVLVLEAGWGSTHDRFALTPPPGAHRCGPPAAAADPVSLLRMDIRPRGIRRRRRLPLHHAAGPSLRLGARSAAGHCKRQSPHVGLVRGRYWGASPRRLMRSKQRP